MSKVVLNSVVLGQSGTAANNFLLDTDAAGALRIRRNSDGSGGTLLVIDSAGLTQLGATSGAAAGRMVLGTAQATTSGQNIDFTSIPSWVKRITVSLAGVSTTGTNQYLLQIGSGSFTTTGYLGCVNMLGVTATNFSAGFILINSIGAASVSHGQIILTHMGSNVWSCQGSVARSDAGNNYVLSGQVPLSGVLDRLRLTTVGATDSFDAGSVNVLYEG